MPSYTTSLRLVQPSTGEYPGTWGTQVNTGLTALVDTSVAGTAAITMTTADYTLSTANGATDEARAMVLNLTGTPGAARNVICPAVSKLYVVYNNTTGGFAQTLKTASGSGISVPNGRTAFLRCDGTNVVEAVNYAASLSLAGTANGVMYLNGSNVVTTGSGLVFDGTNLGIGTSSPGYKLTVEGSSPDIVAANTGANGTRIAITASNTAAYVSTTYSGSGIPLIFNTAGIGAAGSTQMTLDASGNLGLGVTPSAWTGSGGKNIEIGATGNAIFGSASLTTYTSNANFDSSWKYTRTGFASRYEQQDSAHRWYTAPSGTAGNAISFTQALTLDANRNLLLNGTTAGASAVGTLAIFNGTAPTGSVTDGVILFAQDISSSSELRVRDEAGNVTTLSPHNFSLIPEGPSEDMAWAYYSEKGGKRINVDMLKLARMVENLTGEKLVYES
jgi:hypothetical protein